MFLSESTKADQIKHVAIRNLDRLGVKAKAKKTKLQECRPQAQQRVFGVALHCLPMTVVTLRSGQQLNVPIILHQLCGGVLPYVKTEGIFRKEGAKARLNQYKQDLNSNKSIDGVCNGIDFASLVKIFLRELPQPLIPYNYHDTFLQCTLLPEDRIVEALLLACLLLPIEHLCALAYVMHFLNEVAQYSGSNKMTMKNLAIVIAPNMFPPEGRNPFNTNRMERFGQIVELLIENSGRIGVVPPPILDAITEVAGQVERKKKRRSTSITSNRLSIFKCFSCCLPKHPV